MPLVGQSIIRTEASKPTHFAITTFCLLPPDRIEGNTVTQNGEPLFKIHRRHAARKTQGCYRELLPTLEYVKQEQKQEKPSIRDQLRTAAKQQPEKKSPVKSKTHDMEL